MQGHGVKWESTDDNKRLVQAISASKSGAGANVTVVETCWKLVECEILVQGHSAKRESLTLMKDSYGKIVENSDLPMLYCNGAVQANNGKGYLYHSTEILVQ